MLIHIAMFDFSGAGEDQVDQILQAMLKLPQLIPQIQSLSVGPNIHQKYTEFTHAFVVTFQDEEAVAAYRQHPAHQPIAELVKVHARNRLGCDLAVSGSSGGEIFGFSPS